MLNSLLQDITLEGKTALVTGGTKGIGKAIANRLARAGARVVVTARTRPTEPNPEHHFIAADLATVEGTAAVAKEIKENFGGVDILIENVGGLRAPGGGFSTLTDEHWEKELSLNLLPAIRLDRELLPGMIEKKSGVIIHISSVAGKIPLWEINMAYAASKAALNSYSKALANEVASKGVRVLTVSPGGVATEPMVQLMQNFGAGSGATSNQVYKSLTDRFGGVPMNRMAETRGGRVARRLPRLSGCGLSHQRELHDRWRCHLGRIATSTREEGRTTRFAGSSATLILTLQSPQNE